MARQVPFTEHEAALLLDAYLKVLSGERLRMDAVQECSSMLRQMAINVGAEIDDVYRNVNGISFQMASMESAYQGYTIMKPATKLFTDMVFLYRNNINQYQNLLREAKDMANAKQNNEAVFMSWLSETVSKAQLSELYLALSEIEQQARKTKLIQASLYESFDLVSIKKIKATIESSKIFRFMHKRQWGRIILALNYLMKFANQKSAEAKKKHEALRTVVSGTKGEFTEIPNLLNSSENGNDMEGIFEKTEEKIAESKMAADGFSTVNFEAVTSMIFSTPVSLSYFGEVKQESSWASLYVDACRLLLDDYPNVFIRLKEEGLANVEKIWIVDEQHLYLLAVPEKIDDTLFVETGRSASDFVKNLKSILDECAVDYENMVITYIEREEKCHAGTEKSATIALQEQYQKDEKEIFYRWLRDDQKMAEATCRSYISAISQSSKIAIDNNVCITDLLLVEDVNQLRRILADLLNVPVFRELNNRQNNRFRTALSKLILYRLSFELVPAYTTTVVTSSISMAEEPIHSIPEETYARYAEILSEYFSENGYQLGRAIFRGRFKRFYAERYGNNPLETDECIDEIVSAIGTMRDDRIFPKQDEKQDDLISKIIEDILSAFNTYASAVYIEAIYDKYQNQLAENLQIYNSEALASLLLARADGKFTRRYSFLTDNLSEADSQGDLLRIMKGFHQPQNYVAIHEKAWFLPYEKMKSILVTTPSIVNVAAETYFYAPNLPVNVDELSSLSSLLYEELNYHNYITDVHLMQLIRDKCPSIAINTDGFTIYGLRNCLGYILRKQYDFNGPIITMKGNTLSMADVYTEFARDHEFLSVEDLS